MSGRKQPPKPRGAVNKAAATAAPTPVEMPPPVTSTAPATAAAAVRIKQEPGTASSASTSAAPAATATVKTERLPSYREQRDLTLGGLAPGRNSRSTANKKVFVPNLNVARNKNADVLTSRDTSASGSSRSGSRGRGGGGKSERGRGASSAGAKPSTLVQTTGLFSEGTGEAKLRKSSSVFDRNSGAGESASQMRRPTLIKREQRLDPAAERKSIQEVLGTIVDDDDDADAEARAQAVSVAAETGSADADQFAPIPLEETRAQQLAPNALRYPETVAELFERDVEQQQLFVMQLPDTLPGHGPDVEPAESAEADAAAAAEALRNPRATFCTAGQLEDGLIGRVVRRKSGLIQVILGDVVNDVSVGIDPGWLQEVISVQTTDAARRQGDMINLGQIGAKLNVVPDWERLFEAKAREAGHGRQQQSRNGGGSADYH